MNATDDSPRDFAWSIYRHADTLQHQRHYNFATTEAFLFVAAGAGLANSATLSTFVPPVAVIGAMLAVVWWLATVRLERPQRAILMRFVRDPTYAPYEQATWKGVYGCLLINDLPPTLVLFAWAAIFVASVGLPVFSRWLALLLIPLSFFAAGLLHWIESSARDAFLCQHRLDKPFEPAQPNEPLQPTSGATGQAKTSVS